MSFDAAMQTAVSGLRAQTKRLRVVAENLANADTTASEPGGQPYRGEGRRKAHSSGHGSSHRIRGPCRSGRLLPPSPLAKSVAYSTNFSGVPRHDSGHGLN